MKKLSLATLLGAFALAGCATVDTEVGNSVHAQSKEGEMTYLTGSKIPLRADGNAQGVKVSVPDALERQEMSNMRQRNPDGR